MQTLHLFLIVGLRRGHHADNAYAAFYDRPIAGRDTLRGYVVDTLQALYGGLVPPPGEERAFR